MAAQESMQHVGTERNCWNCHNTTRRLKTIGLSQAAADSDACDLHMNRTEQDKTRVARCGGCCDEARNPTLTAKKKDAQLGAATRTQNSVFFDCRDQPDRHPDQGSFVAS